MLPPYGSKSKNHDDLIVSLFKIPKMGQKRGTQDKKTNTSRLGTITLLKTWVTGHVPKPSFGSN